ncbi:MAG: vWA domain-containing protein [Thermoguttaceae bacterium]
MKTHFVLLPLAVWLTLLNASSMPAKAADDRQSQPPYQNNARLVLVLDVSGSMKEEGRFDRMIEAASALVVSLPEDAEVAVVRFHSVPSVLVPQTRLADADRRRVLETIQNQAPPEGGTDILAAAKMGLDLLGDGHGHLVVLSDGYQTGDGTALIPQSVWAPQARELTAEARRRSVLIHSIALGPDALADSLLHTLAAETGGGFHPVRIPADLIKEFVGLASEIGRFWRCSQPGEFQVASITDVVQVASAGADHQLFRVAGGRRIPLDPALHFERNLVRADQFRLTPGTYAFQPSGGHSDLLRPMQIDWNVPHDLRLAAGRRQHLEITAHPRAGEAFDRERLRVVTATRYDGREASEKLVTSLSGRDETFKVSVLTPDLFASFVADVSAEQDGWTCVVGRIWGRLLRPEPLQVALTDPKASCLTPVVVVTHNPSENSFVVPLTARCETQGRAVTMHVASTNASLRVAPDCVALQDGTSEIQVQVQRVPRPNSNQASLESGEFAFTVSAADLGVGPLEQREVRHECRPGDSLEGFSQAKRSSNLDPLLCTERE